MRFGLHLTNQHPPGTDMVRALEDQLHLLRYARSAGWSSVWAGQHFLSEGLAQLQLIPYVGRLAADSGDMEVGLGVQLLSLLNPLLVAEELVSLDIITGGRLIYGCGLGYRNVENRAFRVEGSKVARFEANLGVVRRLWGGEEVSIDFPWCRLDRARLELLPAREGGLPVWLAANADPAVRRAARLGDAWLIGPHSRIDVMAKQLSLYHDARAEAGLDPPCRYPIVREAYCLPDAEEAWRAVEPHLQRKYATYVAWGQDEVVPDGKDFSSTFRDLAADRFMIGDPDDVCAALTRLRDELSATDVILRVHWPTMPISEAMDSLRILSQDVLPSFLG